MLTKYVDLSVQTGKKEETMCFLITSLGNEDLILGYPWLTTFKLQFNWTNGVIGTSYLPIVIPSLDWQQLRIRPTIAKGVTKEAPPLSQIQQAYIQEELAQESTICVTRRQLVLLNLSGGF